MRSQIDDRVISTLGFKEQSPRGKVLLQYLIIGVVLLQFCFFKFFYPNISFIHGDSFSYISAAYHNLSINTYPIGYSRFLRFVSVFNKSDMFLAVVQYILIQCASLIFIYHIILYFRPSRTTAWVLVGISTLNPLYLYLANLVSSDGFFLSISLLWLTILLKLLYQPSKSIVVVHAIIVFLAFITRYNALLYPLLSLIVILISKLRTIHKLQATTLVTLVCFSFVVFTSIKYKRLTGHFQFSPFSGWQLANNAMYAYRYVRAEDRIPVPKRFEAINRFVTEYYDTTRNLDRFPEEGALASTFYMWSKGMPLMKYRDSLFSADPEASELKKWASMSPLYKSFGLYIIKNYPTLYLRKFIWPNANKYYAPPVEFLEYYNSNKDTIPLIARAWFGYSIDKVKVRMKDKRVYVLSFYPYLVGIVNVLMLCCLVYYILLRGWKYFEYYNPGLFAGMILWISNAVFTVIASSAALRFQTFPIVTTLTFVIIIIDWMIKVMRIMQKTENIVSESNELAIDINYTHRSGK